MKKTWSQIRLFLFSIFIGLLAILLVLSSEVLELGGYNKPLLASALQAIGIGLLTSVILGLFAELALRRQMVRDFSIETESQLRSFFDLALTSSQKYGFKGLTDDFAARSFFEQSQPGDEVLWLDTYMPGHQTWIELIKKKAQEGVTFRFLALKPGSAMADLRRAEIGGRFLESFDPELTIFIQDLHAAAEASDTQSNIEVRLYDDLLANPYYLIRRKSKPIYAITSFYLRRATGVDFPHIEWREGDSDGGFIKRLEDYFDWKWQAASPLAQGSKLEET